MKMMKVYEEVIDLHSDIQTFIFWNVQREIRKIILKSSMSLVGARLYYQEKGDLFIIFSQKAGLTAILQEGIIALHAPTFVPQQSDKTFDLLSSYEKNGWRFIKLLIILDDVRA